MAEPTAAGVTCQQAVTLLLDYLTGDLEPALRAVLEQHLERCSDCDAFLRTYAHTMRVTRTIHYDDLPLDMQHRLLQTLHHQMSGGRPQ